MREHTVLSITYYMATMRCHCKGSSNSTSAITHLLRTQALHQRFHHYVPRHDFVWGIENEISDLSSRSAHITDANLLHRFDTHFPQPLPRCMWNPSINRVFCVFSALQWRPLPRAFLLQELPLKIPTGRYGPPYVPTWNSNH